jgi:hypothetical protein
MTNKSLNIQQWATVATVSTPDGGYKKIYPKSTDQFFYIMDSTGYEKQLGLSFVANNGLSSTILPSISPYGNNLDVVIGYGLTFSGNYPGSSINVSGLTANSLDSINSATAGYTLSATANGRFMWIIPSTGISGDINSIAKFSSSTTISNSQIVDNGNNILIGPTPSFALSLLNINGPSASLTVNGNIYLKDSLNSYLSYNNGIYALTDQSFVIDYNTVGSTIFNINGFSQTLNIFTNSIVIKNNKVGINNLNPVSNLDIVSGGTNSSSSALNISTGYPVLSASLVYRNDGSLLINGAGLGYGSTSAYRPVASADLIIGNNYYGSIDLQGYGVYGHDQGSSIGLNLSLRTDNNQGTYSRRFNFWSANGRNLTIGAESDSVQSINFPSYNDGYIRLNSVNSSTRYLRFATDNGLSQSQVDRFGIQGGASYSNVFFDNIAGITINKGVAPGQSSNGFIDIDPYRYMYAGGTSSYNIISLRTGSRTFSIGRSGNVLAGDANSYIIGATRSAWSNGFIFDSGGSWPSSGLILSDSHSGIGIRAMTDGTLYIGDPIQSSNDLKYGGIVINTVSTNANVTVDGYPGGTSQYNDINHVGIFGSTVNGGSFIIRGSQFPGSPTIETLYSVTPQVMKNIIGPYWGINTINPTSMLDINSHIISSTFSMFRVRGRGISATSSITIQSIDPTGGTISVQLNTTNKVYSFGSFTYSGYATSSILSSISNLIRSYGFVTNLSYNYLNVGEIRGRNGLFNGATWSITTSTTTSIFTVPFSGGYTQPDPINIFSNGVVAIGLTNMGLTSDGVTFSGVSGPSLQLYGTQSVLSIKDGSQGFGYILTSDSNGVASWNRSSNSGTWSDVSSQVVCYNGFTVSSAIQYIKDISGGVHLKGSFTRYDGSLTQSINSYVQSGTGISIVIADFPASLISQNDLEFLTLPGFNSSYLYNVGDVVADGYNITWIAGFSKVTSSSTPPAPDSVNGNMRLVVYIPYGATLIGPNTQGLSIYINDIKYTIY